MWDFGYFVVQCSFSILAFCVVLIFILGIYVVNKMLSRATQLKFFEHVVLDFSKVKNDELAVVSQKDEMLTFIIDEKIEDDGGAAVSEHLIKNLLHKLLKKKPSAKRERVNRSLLAN